MNFNISRRSLLLGGIAGLGSSVVSAQSPKSIYGVLFRGITEIEYGFEDYFRINKFPVHVSYVNINRNLKLIPDIVADIKRVKPDLVYSWGTSVTLALVGRYDAIDPEKHITTIPTVFTLVAAPVFSDIIESMLWPNRNVTGATMMSSIEHSLDAMLAIKKAKKIGILYTPTERNSIINVQRCKNYCTINDIELIAIPLEFSVLNKVNTTNAVKKVFYISEQQADWIILPPDSTLGTISQDFIIPTARKANLPTFATTQQLMDTGATAGYFLPYYRLGLNTGEVAKNILEGQRPHQLAVKQPVRFNYQARWDELQRLNIKVPLLLNKLQLI